MVLAIQNATKKNKVYLLCIFFVSHVPKKAIFSVIPHGLINEYQPGKLHKPAIESELRVADFLNLSGWHAD